MGLRISLHLIPDDLDRLVQRAKLAEAAGFDQLWIAESHLSCRDHNIAQALAILNTARISIGPGITNPVLHDDSVNATTIATLDELSGGRSLMGIGSGDTPVYALGKKMASLKRMRESVHVIRGLLRGEEVEVGGSKVSLKWCKRDIPIYLSAEGPRTIQLAAEIADGVIIGSGVNKETVAWVTGNIDKGFEVRDPALGPLHIIFGAMCSVDPDGAAAREKVRARVANRAHHNFRDTLDSVPDQYKPEIQNLLDNFDVTDWRSPKHIPLITDYILDRFTITGTAAECVSRIKEIEGYGVGSLMIDPPVPDFDESMGLFAKGVLPKCV